MRIISGKARGRRFSLPKGSSIRPTSDKIKEALFNILRPSAGKYFLDIFAGSGNIGLEALSRGAARVVFIEDNAILAGAIKKTIIALDFSERAETLTMDVRRGIHELVVRGERFDILFIDPPYERDLIEKTLQYLEDGKLFFDDAVVVVQHSAKETLSNTLSNHYLLTDQRKYGYTMLTFLKPT